MNDELRNRNTRILGIDYGKAKIGLALGVGTFAEPLKVIRYQDIEILSEQIRKIVEEEKVEKIVVGISEGEMAEETMEFVKTIRSTLDPIPCDVYDETLSSQDAQRMSREAGLHQKKRHQMEDAFAAAIMLQNYLDSRK